jgi:hypothetical protein
MCVNVGVYDYKTVAARDVASYMSSVGAAESEEETRETLKLLTTHREKCFCAEGHGGSRIPASCSNDPFGLNRPGGSNRGIGTT